MKIPHTPRAARALPALALAAALARPCAAADSERWLYMSNWLSGDADLARAREVVARAADAGFATLALECGAERCGSWDAARRARFASLQALCDARGIDIAPLVWSMGYGSPLWRDFSFAEGAPAEDVRFRVSGGCAEFAPHAPGNLLSNGGFEQMSGNSFGGWNWIDNVGTRTFQDTSVRHGGAASLRAELAKDGKARCIASVGVRPNRQYRFEMWVKTENLTPRRVFRAEVYDDATGRAVATEEATDLAETSDWTRFALLLNSGDATRLNVYAGVWWARGGTFWLDDVAVTELGLVEPLRRAGTPFAVRDAAGAALVEGVDFAPVAARRVNERLDILSDRLALPASSRLRDGDEVFVSYYHPARIERGQIAACMSDPAIFAYFEETARDVQAVFRPRRWFLDMDEIRAGGTCAACAAKQTDMAHILAGCIRRQLAAIQTASPACEVWAWSDMFDPNHNAHGDYYACKGSYAGAGDLIPAELGIVCWNGGTKEESLAYFSARGHLTLAAGYYDADDLSGDRAWRAAGARTPGCLGMMYTTWEGRYGLLEDFAALGTWTRLPRTPPRFGSFRVRLR